MANEEHLAIFRKGVDAWNRWRAEAPEIEPNLAGADLRKCNLSAFNLSKVNLGQLDYTLAFIREALLGGPEVL